MSGGCFDYAYIKVQIFIDELSCRLDAFERLDEWGQKPNYFEPATLAKLHEIKDKAEHTMKLMKAVEWLYSCDSGEDTFLRRVAEIEKASP